VQDLPVYLHELSMAPLKHENVIDKDLVLHLMNVSDLTIEAKRRVFINSSNLVQIDRRITKTFDEVCQDILDRKSVEYVGAYELMKHDKMKMQCFAGGAQVASASRV